MTADFPDYIDVEYTDGEGEDPSEYPALESKIEKAIDVTRQGLEEYENPAVMWTGGKDSTLTLYFINEVADEFGFEKPTAVFIDHYQHFDEITDFVEHWADEWGIDLVYARNEDVGSYVDENGLGPGDDIPVDALGDHNQHHIRNILEYEDETFPFLLDTYVGNHLLKTVALNDALETHEIDGVISGVRWDEQEARADETFFSPRHDPDTYPPHDRVHPILQFKEADVWDAFWHYVVPEAAAEFPDSGHVPQSGDDLPDGVEWEDVPISPKYVAGFRSLGSEVSTEKTTDEPAWLQNLEDTTERAGRAQDKEDLMERLRDLGYM
ncbi:phosphoadenosine phosphosulfate reductase family protein [Halovenus rubra]|uniref:Phosphoadenosine phosphosulfate reductase family protein n=2 Tax=Halovenus rubra TaxID=869890 RepID=A0ABD5X6B4_9EURY|nr:phosphoadenosine phosphosulfate reductase family protein [Halovenus rubra]